LLSFIPDVLFIEGLKAYLINPLATDSSVYSYGINHVIYAGKYRIGTWNISRIKVEGTGVMADSFDWTEINKSGDILEMVEDLNIDTVAKAQERGDASLRKAEMESISGLIRIPVNCAQQLYDVIEITDPPAGLAAAKRRVLGISLSYLPAKAEYDQKFLLGGV
jgi:hypothetical protein